QICQSRRYWYGATIHGRRSGFPGLHGNSYGLHCVSSPSTVSVVPSKTISSRTRPTDPKAPYVFTNDSRSKAPFIVCRDDRRFRTGFTLSAATRRTSAAVTAVSARDRDRAAAAARPARSTTARG